MDISSKAEDVERTASPESTHGSKPDLMLPDIPDASGSPLVRRMLSAALVVIGLVSGGALLVGIFVPIDLTIDAPGRLEPVTVRAVRAQETAIVTGVPVATGDTVREGETLATLDSLQLSSQLAQLRAERNRQWVAVQRSRALQPIEAEEQELETEQARAQLIRARANLREALANYGYSTNVEEVLETYDTGTHIAIDRALAEVVRARSAVGASQQAVRRLGLSRFDREQQRAELNQLDARIASVESRLNRLTIRAPADGVVLTDAIERLPGRLVKAGDVLFDVADLEAWRVELLVGEQSVHKVAPGDEVKIDVAAFQSESRDLLHGTVTSIGSEPVAPGDMPPGSARGPNRNLYRVTVRIAQADIARVGRDRLRQGYSVEGKIITSSGPIIVLLWRYLRGLT